MSFGRKMAPLLGQYLGGDFHSHRDGSAISDLVLVTVEAFDCERRSELLMIMKYFYKCGGQIQDFGSVPDSGDPRGALKIELE